MPPLPRPALAAARVQYGLLSVADLDRTAVSRRTRAAALDSGLLSKVHRNVYRLTSHEETFERDLVDRTALHAELRRMAAEVAGYLQRDGLSARTVTTKLRYDDFSLRSRSTTLQTPIDEPERIGDLACQLLDRGLRDRPGALRLVGVGVSGLTAVRQLTLDEL